MTMPLIGTKAKIIEVSVRLFALHGFSGVSVRDIAKEVGIKDASIYSHFSSKDELLDIIICHFKTAFLSSIPTVEQLEHVLSNCPPWAFLLEGFHLFKLRVADPVLAWTYLVLMREQYGNSLAAQAWSNHRELVIGYLENAFCIMIAKNQIPNHDPRSLACLYEYPMLLLIGLYVTELCNNRATQVIEDQILDHNRFFFELSGIPGPPPAKE